MTRPVGRGLEDSPETGPETLPGRIDTPLPSGFVSGTQTGKARLS